MINHDVEIDLKGSICKDCGNIDYWDGYFCSVKELTPLNPTRESLTNISKCDKFIVRKPHFSCKINREICPFWCDNCEGFKNRWESIV